MFFFVLEKKSCGTFRKTCFCFRDNYEKYIKMYNVIYDKILRYCFYYFLDILDYMLITELRQRFPNTWTEAKENQVTLATSSKDVQ